MERVNSYPIELQNIDVNSIEFINLPLSDTLHYIARQKLPEHLISSTWHEFLKYHADNYNGVVSMNDVTNKWRKWSARKSTYSKLNAGQAKYKNFSNSPVHASVEHNTDVMFGNNNNRAHGFDYQAHAANALARYSADELVALGYDPKTGMRQEWL